MTFVADSMLGKLARWLRILGYDTDYDPFAEDDALLLQAEAEDRILLTRDVPLAGRAPEGRCVLIAHNKLDGQMAQLVQTLGLDLDRETFTRCLICNDSIVDVPRDAIKARVPPYVFQTQTRFHRCPSCRRVYWRGTHLDRMAERLARIKTEAAKGASGPETGGYRP